MSHLSPQKPNDHPHLKDAGAPAERANSTDSPTGVPLKTPTPALCGCYGRSMGQNPPVAGFGSNDPVLMEVQRKRSATRKVSLSSGTIGLITMIIQMIITTSICVAGSFSGQQYMGSQLLALLMMIAAPFVVGPGWVATFILALIACIRAHSRTPRVQPDGWGEAKTPTSALLAVSIVAGIPTLVAYVMLFSSALFDSSYALSHNLLQSLLVACDLMEALILVGFVFLLRMSMALDSAARVSQAPRAQSA